MRKALVIHPHGIQDMGDLLAIARAEGKKAFRSDGNVRVFPHIFMDDEGNFIVEVEVHNASGVGASRSEG